jgi:hypothetical protein
LRQLPQASRIAGSARPAVSLAATSDTAPRIAASRAATAVGSKLRGSSPAGSCRAVLGTTEPSSSDAPTAPAGTIPERILRYLFRNVIAVIPLSTKRQPGEGSIAYRPAMFIHARNR